MKRKENSDRALIIYDFDNIDDWAPKLEAALCPFLPNSVKQKLVEVTPKFIEDALDFLFELTDRNAIINVVLAWLQSGYIAGYHGTRLTDAELSSVQTFGLISLNADARSERLTRVLSSHHKWPEMSSQLDIALQAHGQGEIAGHRQGQVHLTLSRCGLTDSFNHYLSYGSEFDKHVATSLLGHEGGELLTRDGKPCVIQVAIPGDLALKAAHPFFSIDVMRGKGEVPNLANDFLKSWCYRLANPNFQSRELRLDCGMVFYQTIPAAWIQHYLLMP